MLQTRLEKLLTYTLSSITYLLYRKLTNLSISILNMLLGFFISTALSTIPGQTGDWGIIAAAIIVTFYEVISKIIYPIDQIVNRSESIVRKQINNIKIGILYGLFVDAFKLGS